MVLYAAVLWQVTSLANPKVMFVATETFVAVGRISKISMESHSPNSKEY